MSTGASREAPVDNELFTDTCAWIPNKVVYTSYGANLGIENKREGEETSISRYAIDKKNMDNGRLHTIRIVWVRLEEVVEPQYTGEKPS